MSRARDLAVMVGLVATLTSCEGGLGLPKQLSGEAYPGERREVTGTIEVDDFGCIRVRLDGGESYWAVWPASANLGQDDYVNLGWFQADLGVGDRLRGTAALTPLASLAQAGSGYWPHAISGCTELGETDAIVFDRVEAVDD